MQENEDANGVGKGDATQSLLCGLCLSFGRKLLPIGKYYAVCESILSGTSSIDNHSLCSVNICWECKAMFRRVIEFKNKIITAQEVLASPRSKAKIRSLSTLHCSQKTEYDYELIHVTADIVKQEVKAERESLNDSIANFDAVQTIEITIDKNIKTDEVNDYEDANKQRILCIPDLHPHFDDPITDSYYDESSNHDTKYDIQLEDSLLIDTVIKMDIKKKTPKKRNYKVRLYMRKEGSCDSFVKDVQFTRQEVNDCRLRKSQCRPYTLRRYRCELCIVGYNTEKRLLEHKRKFHSKAAGPYVCDICSKRFTHKGPLANHVDSHYTGIKCTLCRFTCYHRQQMYAHHRRLHQSVYECSQCHVKFDCKQECLEHYDSLHTKFVCDLCGKTYKEKISLQNHIRRKHMPHVCKICNKQYKKSSMLRYHHRLKHGPKAPMHDAYCVECDLHFDQVKYYKAHLLGTRKHLPKDKTTFPCKECKKTFSRNNYLMNHYKLQHLKKTDYHCEKCNKYYCNGFALRLHKQRVHEGMRPIKNKVCQLCGRGFGTARILENHVRTHTGERPFQCDKCPSSFKQKASLTIHVRSVHMKDRKFK